MRSLAVTIALIANAVPQPALAQRKDCQQTQFPKQLPAPSAILDSAQAIADLSRFRAPPGGMVFTVMYDETDSVPSTWPLAIVDSQAVVPFARTLRPRKPQDTWAVRVRIVGGGGGGAVAAITLERSMYCPPSPSEQDRSYFPVRIMVQRQPSDRPPSTHPTRIDFEARISETGQVITVRLVGSTGLREIDDDVLRRWQLRRFHPALVDGMPVEAWYHTNGSSPRL